MSKKMQKREIQANEKQATVKTRLRYWLEEDPRRSSPRTLACD
uniref:Uncharacterized protein n=1 Tax=Anguilla anguilla TaxID=7936 RepID=A0A0E9RJJ6_ANGAN